MYYARLILAVHKSGIQHFIASVINFELAAMMDRQLASLTSLTN